MHIDERLPLAVGEQLDPVRTTRLVTAAVLRPMQGDTGDHASPRQPDLHDMISGRVRGAPCRATVPIGQDWCRFRERLGDHDRAHEMWLQPVVGTAVPQDRACCLVDEVRDQHGSVRVAQEVVAHEHGHVGVVGGKVPAEEGILVRQPLSVGVERRRVRSALAFDLFELIGDKRLVNFPGRQRDSIALVVAVEVGVEHEPLLVLVSSRSR